MTPEKFAKLPYNKQAVLVAKDVITQVKAKKYRAKRQSYVRFSDASTQRLINSDENKELHTVLPNLNCHVCARGALFLSHIKYADQFKIKQLNIGRDFWSGDVPDIYDKEILKRDMPFDTLNQYMMETAFELEDIDDHLLDLIVPPSTLLTRNGKPKVKEKVRQQMYDAGHLLVAACIKFGSRYKNIDNRLIAIMKNVVKNKGAFVPYDR